MIVLGPVSWLGWYALVSIGLGVGAVKIVQAAPSFLAKKLPRS